MKEGIWMIDFWKDGEIWLEVLSVWLCCRWEFLKFCIGCGMKKSEWEFGVGENSIPMYLCEQWRQSCSEDWWPGIKSRLMAPLQMRRAWEIVHWFSERLLPRRRPIKFEEIYEHLDSPSTRSHGRDNMLIGPEKDIGFTTTSHTFLNTFGRQLS